jgi:hypothetical protein
MKEEKKLAALRMLSKPRKPEPKKPVKKPMIVIDGQEFTYAPAPDHSCYSCIHYIEQQSPDVFEHAPLTTPGNRRRYCDATNSHNLHTWPFAHTVCAKWEHERAPQVEEEE